MGGAPAADEPGPGKRRRASGPAGGAPPDAVVTPDKGRYACTQERRAGFGNPGTAGAGKAQTDFAVGAWRPVNRAVIRSTWEEGDQSVNVRLVEAVRSGNLQQVREILTPDTNIEDRDDEGTTLLMAATAASHVGIVKLLVERGADVNARNKAGMTPLHMSAAVRHLDGLAYLLQRGADINAVDEEGNTVLMVAARTGFAQGVDLLIKKRAPVNAANRWGTTALMQAARVGNINVMKMLLDAGADPAATDVLGKRAITYAKEKGAPPVYLTRLLGGDRQSPGKNAARPAGDRPWWRFWEK
jgi:hypothetical protein